MNRIIRSLICGGQVSLTVMDTTRLVNDAIAIHNTDRYASSILGGLLTCGAYLAASLSGSAGVSLTIKAKDGDGAVAVSSDSELHVRGYADGACTRTLAGGTLTVVREQSGAMPFVGTCEIESDDISDILETYFGQSEQIPTAAAITCEIGADGKCMCAGGAVLQLLPDADEEQIARAGEAFEKFKAREGALYELGAEGVYQKFFSGLYGGGKYELNPVYKCNCSEEKLINILRAVGKKEVLDIIKEQGVVSVHCHYCNKDYFFDESRIAEIFGE